MNCFVRKYKATSISLLTREKQVCDREWKAYLVNRPEDGWHAW